MINSHISDPYLQLVGFSAMKSFPELLQVKLGRKNKPSGIIGADFLHARCYTCCTTNSIKVMKETQNTMTSENHKLISFVISLLTK